MPTKFIPLPVGTPCSLYRDHCIRVEVNQGGVWRMHSEHSDERRAQAEVDAINPQQARVIRVRVELVSI